MPNPFLTLTLILLTTTITWATPTETELAQKAKSNGTFEALVSTNKDPVGEVGLWGFTAKVVVPNSCRQAFTALRDIESYPKRMEKVKRVIVLERGTNTLLTDYTEGGMGIEARTTILWKFKDQPPLQIVSENVGPEDSKTWMKTRFVEVGHPHYCELNIRLFADTSFIPNFMMKWLTETVVEETATEYRRLIAESVAAKKAKGP
ncbi:MAG: hypothetical protein CMH56_09140 [Myxococcales bacterium]|nr:hypothetical protein [Myxococcales bacterium]